MASRPSLLPWLSLATLVVVIDQVAKAAVSRSLRLGDSHKLTDWLNVVCWHNTGAAFSFLHDASGWQRWLFVALAVAAVVFIVWMLSRHGAQRLFSTALALIRAAEGRSGRRQRIIMLTGHAEPGDALRLERAGADGYVAKPINPAQLLAEVSRVSVLNKI